MAKVPRRASAGGPPFIPPPKAPPAATPAPPRPLNLGLVIHQHVVIELPRSIAVTMLAAQSGLPNPSLEYGMYLRGVWDSENLRVRISGDEYYLPRQTVTAASIEFDEDPPGPEWNVVIHRHPPSCRKFSSTDNSSINREFLASLLFIPPWEFPDAIVNIPIALGTKLQVPAEVRVDSLVQPDAALMRSMHERVKERRYSPQPARTANTPHVGPAGMELLGFDPEDAADISFDPTGGGFRSLFNSNR